MFLKKLKTSFLFFVVISIFGCENSDHLPNDTDYSKKIIGKWKQIKSFELINSSKNPQEGDWIPVENGFIVEFKIGNDFIYSKYGTCMEGSYSIDSKLGKIDFAFDCEIEFDGKKIQNLTEEFEINNSKNSQIYLWHPREIPTGKGIASLLEKVN